MSNSTRGIWTFLYGHKIWPRKELLTNFIVNPQIGTCLADQYNLHLQMFDELPVVAARSGIPPRWYSLRFPMPRKNGPLHDFASHIQYLASRQISKLETSSRKLVSCLIIPFMRCLTYSKFSIILISCNNTRWSQISVITTVLLILLNQNFHYAKHSNPWITLTVWSM